MRENSAEYSLDLRIHSEKLRLLPLCRQKIELRRDTVTRAFTCPVCGCAFRHNARKWIIALPIVVILALGLLYLLHDTFIPPIFIAFVLVPMFATIILMRFPTYIVIATPDAPREV
jgi:hypothetical protein